MNNKRTPEIDKRIVYMYQAGVSNQRIAAEFNLSPQTIHRVLKLYDIKLHPRGWKGDKCMDCGKPTNGAKRCKLHRIIHNAEMNRIYKGGMPYGGDVGVWKVRKSGKYGPKVRQLETGD